MTRREQFGYLPMCTPAKGKPWFCPNALRYQAKDSREAFINMTRMNDQPDAWKALKIEGWRIIRVKISVA